MVSHELISYARNELQTTNSRQFDYQTINYHYNYYIYFIHKLYIIYIYIYMYMLCHAMSAISGL